VQWLNSSIDEHEEVEYTEPHDLDHAIETQGIIDNDDLVNEGEDEEREVHRHCVTSIDLEGGGIEVIFDCDEDIAV
jgi:hypothetical protein